MALVLHSEEYEWLMDDPQSQNRANLLLIGNLNILTKLLTNIFLLLFMEEPRRTNRHYFSGGAWRFLKILAYQNLLDKFYVTRPLKWSGNLNYRTRRIRKHGFTTKVL